MQLQLFAFCSSLGTSLSAGLLRVRDHQYALLPDDHLPEQRERRQPVHGRALLQPHLHDVQRFLRNVHYGERPSSVYIMVTCTSALFPSKAIASPAQAAGFSLIEAPTLLDNKPTKFL